MASSAMPFHIRSNSLPSRPHPIVSQVEENLRRSRSAEATSTSSSSISSQLNGLQDLHASVDELLLSPLIQQAIPSGSTDLLLDGSLRLIDACSIIKDVLSQTKDSAQEIQSVLRRRCNAQPEIKSFMSTRKAATKATNKALKGFKVMGSKSSSNNETEALLIEAQAQTVFVFESLLFFINGKKASSRSLVSKIVRSKRVAPEEEENEFAKVDCAVQSLIGHKGSAENVQNRIKDLDLCIQDLEDGVDSLFRRFIKIRVSLLNIINH